SSVTAQFSDPNHGPSPHLVEKLVDQAIEKCRAIENGIAVERAGLRRQLMMLAGVAAVAAILITFGPAFLRSGKSALLILSRSAEAARPYKIDVAPGDDGKPAQDRSRAQRHEGPAPRASDAQGEALGVHLLRRDADRPHRQR